MLLWRWVPRSASAVNVIGLMIGKEGRPEAAYLHLQPNGFGDDAIKLH